MFFPLFSTVTVAGTMILLTVNISQRLGFALCMVCSTVEHFLHTLPTALHYLTVSVLVTFGTSLGYC